MRAGCFRKEPSREVKIVSGDLRPPANNTCNFMVLKKQNESQ